MNRQVRRACSIGLRISREVASLLLLLSIVIGVVFLVLHLEVYVQGKTLKSPSDMLNALNNSAILGTLESVSIITGFIIFFISGRKERRRQQRAETLAQMESSGDVKKSGTTKSLLENLNRKGESFRGFEFKDSLDLSEIFLKNVDLSRSKLFEVNLINSTLNDSNFWGAKMRHAQLKSAELKRADFTYAHLNDADFSGSRLQDTCFNDADLQRCIFKGADLRGCTFRGAKLKGANFDRAENLPLKQIILADNWSEAIFSVEDKEKLDNLVQPRSATKP
jgi:uncharacterized protein YjbI with pentapeptide repeats